MEYGFGVGSPQCPQVAERLLGRTGPCPSACSQSPTGRRWSWKHILRSTPTHHTSECPETIATVERRLTLSWRALYIGCFRNRLVITTDSNTLSPRMASRALPPCSSVVAASGSPPRLLWVYTSSISSPSMGGRGGRLSILGRDIVRLRGTESDASGESGTRGRRGELAVW